MDRVKKLEEFFGPFPKGPLTSNEFPPKMASIMDWRPLLHRYNPAHYGKFMDLTLFRGYPFRKLTH